MKKQLFSCRQLSLGGIFLRTVLLVVLAMAGSRVGAAAVAVTGLEGTSGEYYYVAAQGDGATAPEFADNAIRLYPGNTLTVSTDTRLLTKIVIAGTANGKNKFAANQESLIDASDGEMSATGKTWTGEDGYETVTFTNMNDDDATGYLAIATLNVTFKPLAAAGISFDIDTDDIPSKKYIVLPQSDFDSPQLTNDNDVVVTFTSSDTDIAAIDEDGIVTIGSKTGTATITAASAATREYKAGSATYKIQVTQATVGKNETALSGFFLDGEKVTTTLAVAGTEVEDFTAPEFQITFTTSSYKPEIESDDIERIVTFSSNNKEIAEVDEVTGDITFGEKEGTVTITAKVTSEKNQFAEKSYTYKIKVSKAALAAQFVDDDGEKLTAVTLLPGSDFELPALAATSGDDDVEVESFTITSSNTDVASYDEENELLTIGTAVGTATLTATVSAGPAYKTATTTLKITTKQATATARFLDDEERTVSTVSLKATETGDFTAPTLSVAFSGMGFNPAIDFDEDGAVAYTVEYTSSNEDVATVNESGEVEMGEQTGTATITARVSSEQNQFAALTATYTIDVAPVALKATFAEASYSTRTGRELDEVNVLTIEDADGNEVSDYEVVNTTSDADIADVDAETGAVTIGRTTGTARITATVTADWMYAPTTATYDIDVAEGYATLHVTAAGYATYCGDEALDFSAVDGLTAYTASIDADGWLSFDEAAEVPAREGVLIEGSEGDYEVPVIDEAAEVDNAFIGVTEPTVVSTPGIYVLLRGAEGVGFYRTTTAFTVGAHTAYLPALPAETRPFIAIGGSTGGIGAVRSEDSRRAVYNLHGQRVSQTRRGLYIVDGRKVSVR